MKLSELFYECAFNVDDYEKVGTKVNYKFKEDGNHLYIYFRGSSSIGDGLRNFWFFERPYKDMEIPYKVHSGFLSGWKQVEDIVIEKIKATNDDGSYKYQNITVVGYSHGGALSGFCHECCWFHRPDIRDNIFGYGFESPRFYHGYRVKKVLQERWENYTVIKNANDIVPHCPPYLFCFCHVGNELKLNPDTGNFRKPKFIGAHYQDAVYYALLSYENDAAAEEWKTKRVTVD